MSEIKTSVISARTLIPISAVGVIIIGTIWIVNLQSKGTENERRVMSLETGATSQQKEIQTISERTVRIETKLDILIDKK